MEDTSAQLSAASGGGGRDTFIRFRYIELVTTAAASESFLLPIFPLPNLVFFPQTRLPLHIFEPRYRQMIGDALEGDRRIGIVLLRPGWETDYFGAPPVHSVATLGVIEQEFKLDDGRYNLLVGGETRVRILEEVSADPYRIARVVPIPQTAPDLQLAYAEREWLVELSRRYLEYLPGQMEVPELATAALEPLTNALIMSLPMEVEEKQKLLELDDVLARAEHIGTVLEEKMQALQFLEPFRADGSDPAKN